MTDLIDNLKKLMVVCLGTLLCSCGNVPYLTTYDHGCQRPEPWVSGVAVGAGAGVIAGGVIGGNVLPEAIVGGTLGGLIAQSNKEKWNIRCQLSRQGVAVVQKGDIIKVYLPVDKVFKTNTYVIKEESYDLLDKLTILLKASLPVCIQIAGNTDDIGTFRSRCNLSDHQARAVADYFWTHGIPHQYLRPIAHSSCDPIAYRWTARGSGYNRRIEITINPLCRYCPCCKY